MSTSSSYTWFVPVTWMKGGGNHQNFWLTTKTSEFVKVLSHPGLRAWMTEVLRHPGCLEVEVVLFGLEDRNNKGSEARTESLLPNQVQCE